MRGIWVSICMIKKTLNSTESLPDILIEPNPGSVNPFKGELSGPQSFGRSYTVWIGSEKSDSPNTMGLPTGASTKDWVKVELWYRIYLPTRGYDANGGVPLPKIHSFERINGKVAACPEIKKGIPLIGNATVNIPPKPEPRLFYSYRASSSGLYATPENEYLGGRLNSSAGKVSIVWFRPPTFPNTENGKPVSWKKETRYWSVCLGGLSTLTSSCFADYQSKKARDGSVKFVIGPRSIKKMAVEAGYNYMSRGLHFVPILIYRNLLTDPNFANHIDFVPRIPNKAWKSAANAKIFAAQNYIGDYAPQGIHCTVEEFRANFCGKKYRNEAI